MGLNTVSHIVSCKPLQSQYFPPRQVQHPERRGHAEIGIQGLKSRIVRNIFSCLKRTTYSGSKRDEGIVEEAYFNDWSVKQLRRLNLRLIAATLNTKFDFIVHETYSKMQGCIFSQRKS